MNSRSSYKAKGGKYGVPEKNVHKQVCEYLRRQYPKVLFRSDSGAGMKLTIGQSVQQAKIQNGDKWPDLFIAEPTKRINSIEVKEMGAKAIVNQTGHFGLFLELKKEGAKLFKKDGSPVNDRIKGQIECMRKLSEKGYKCSFAIGFTEAKKIIDDYLKN